MLIYLFIQKINPLTYLKLYGNARKALIWGIGIGALMIVYQVTRVLVLQGAGGFHNRIGKETWPSDIWMLIKYNANLYSVVLIFCEEVVFRGFLLQKLQGISKFWLANMIQSIAFVLIHVQGWIFLHQFALPTSLSPMLGILIVALILGAVFKKSGSLWACILIHFCADFMI